MLTPKTLTTFSLWLQAFVSRARMAVQRAEDLPSERRFEEDGAVSNSGSVSREVGMGGGSLVGDLLDLGDSSSSVPAAAPTGAPQPSGSSVMDLLGETREV